MQSPMFVFIGVTENSSDASLDVLAEGLRTKFENNEIAIAFTRKEELLLGRLENVSFYVSLLKKKNELKDWYKMAIDFELQLDKKPINKEMLLQRYTALICSSSNQYDKIHFDTGLAIFDEMEKFSNIKILSFQ